MKKFVSIAMGVSALAAVACSPAKEDGNKIYCLKNQSGMEVNITNFGGRITSVLITDKNGVRRDVVLGFDNVEDYYPENHQSDFGAAIGRYANRINQGKFSIDGVEYDLPKNNFGHCLHGGPTGWQYQPYNHFISGRKLLHIYSHFHEHPYGNATKSGIKKKNTAVSNEVTSAPNHLQNSDSDENIGFPSVLPCLNKI